MYFFLKRKTNSFHGVSFWPETLSDWLIEYIDAII